MLTRDNIVRQVAAEVGTPTVAQEVLDYVDRWRTDTATQVPFSAADRPHIAARLRTTRTLWPVAAAPTRCMADKPAADPGPDRDGRQAALGQERLTVEGLVAAGIERRLAGRIVGASGGRNPYRTLYPELESMIALRHRITAEIARGGKAEDVGFGFVHELTSVQQLTRAGLLDGSPSVRCSSDCRPRTPKACSFRSMMPIRSGRCSAAAAGRRARCG